MITVCFPVFNGEKLIKKAIQTTINQIEEQKIKAKILISNNCSEDNTLNICEEFEQKYTYVKIFNHERWDLDLRNINKKNFWLQNNATGRILFGQKNENKFIEKNFTIVKNELSECTIFLNSGGNSVDSPHIKLNDFFLNLLDNFDDILISLFPKIFALNRRVVLRIK